MNAHRELGSRSMLALCLVAEPAFAAEAAGGGGGGHSALASSRSARASAWASPRSVRRSARAARPRRRWRASAATRTSADRIFTPLILGLALMEALALYMLVIAFFLQGKIPG